MAPPHDIDMARVGRLRDPARLEHVDPARIWARVPLTDGDVVVDVGAGVGYVTLPLARAAPGASVVACDILPGMLALLEEQAAAEGLGRVECRVSTPDRLPVGDGEADLVTMLQVHHELDDPATTMRECARILRPGGWLAIVDWTDADNPVSPPGGRRVPAQTIRAHVEEAGFEDVETHRDYAYHTFLTARAPAPGTGSGG